MFEGAWMLLEKSKKNMESMIGWNTMLPRYGQGKRLEAKEEEGWSVTVE